MPLPHLSFFSILVKSTSPYSPLLQARGLLPSHTTPSFPTTSPHITISLLVAQPISLAGSPGSFSLWDLGLQRLEIFLSFPLPEVTVRTGTFILCNSVHLFFFFLSNALT